MVGKRSDAIQGLSNKFASTEVKKQNKKKSGRQNNIKVNKFCRDLNRVVAKLLRSGIRAPNDFNLSDV